MKELENRRCKSGDDGSGQSYMEYFVLIKTEEARFITIVVSAAIIVCLNKSLCEERCGKNGGSFCSSLGSSCLALSARSRGSLVPSGRLQPLQAANMEAATGQRSRYRASRIFTPTMGTIGVLGPPLLRTLD